MEASKPFVNNGLRQIHQLIKYQEYKNNMRIVLITLIFIIGLNSTCNSQSYLVPDSAKRILFLGNSITYMGQYVSYIDAYMTIKYPKKHFEIINAGLPSETVSGLSESNHAGGAFPRPDLHERLVRVLEKVKPDIVFASYGMNDGIYMPFDKERFQKFCDGIMWLNEQVTKSGAEIIHLTPPIYDERKGKAYSNVLDIYSDWLLSCRYTYNWKVIDVHFPMKKYLEEQCSRDTSFKFAEDGIHPNEKGHFVIAKQILLGIGETDIAEDEDIHQVLDRYENGDSILKLVEKRQSIMKDAWLTYTGHSRPFMNVGLSLPEAQNLSDSIDKQIEKLSKNKLPSPTSKNVDWMDLRFQIFKVLPNDKDEIIMVGNSLTHNFEWHEMFRNVNVKNRGISADATKGILKRLPEITESKPNKIFIEIGVNDLLWGVPVDTIFNNYITILQNIKTHSPKTKIYVQSLLPNGRKIANSDRITNDEICNLNQRLQNYCVRNNLTYIDLYSKFEKNKTLNPIYDCGDNLHLSPDGYLLWSKLIKEYIYE